MKVKLTSAILAMAVFGLVNQICAHTLTNQSVKYATDSCHNPVISGSGGYLTINADLHGSVSEYGKYQSSQHGLVPPPGPGPLTPPASAEKLTETVPMKHKMTFAAGTFFNTGSWGLRKSAKSVLDDLYRSTKLVDLEVVIVTGYTDSRGTKEFNQMLSEKRANAVKKYLIHRGIEASNIYAEGRGSSAPLGDNKTVIGRAKNRRVDIEVIGTSQSMNSMNRAVKTVFKDSENTLDHSVHHSPQAKIKKTINK